MRTWHTSASNTVHVCTGSCRLTDYVLPPNQIASEGARQHSPRHSIGAQLSKWRASHQHRLVWRGSHTASTYSHAWHTPLPQFAIYKFNRNKEKEMGIYWYSAVRSLNRIAFCVSSNLSMPEYWVAFQWLRQTRAAMTSTVQLWHEHTEVTSVPWKRIGRLECRLLPLSYTNTHDSRWQGWSEGGCQANSKKQLHCGM